MKKILAIGITAYIMFAIIILMLVGEAGGSASGANLPIFYIINETDADNYKRVCVPLNIPWEIPILIDALDGCEHGDDDMQRYSSLFTTLHFCVIEERMYFAKKVPADSEEAKMPQPELELLVLNVGENFLVDDEGNHVITSPGQNVSPDPTSEPAPTQVPTPEPTQEPVEMITIWILQDTFYYEGQASILKYVEEVGCKSMNDIQDAVTQAAKDKSDETILYLAQLQGMDIPDHMVYLEQLALGEHIDIECIMDIYRDEYLIELFGDGSMYILPEPTTVPERIIELE